MSGGRRIAVFLARLSGSIVGSAGDAEIDHLCLGSMQGLGSEA